MSANPLPALADALASELSSLRFSAPVACVYNPLLYARTPHHAYLERYGAAPRAFLVAPLVGAFFIDFNNALIITGFLNFWPH